MFTEAEAILAQLDELDALLSELAPGDWSRPTRCPPLSFRELFAHVTEGVGMVGRTLGERTDAAPVADRIEVCKGWAPDPETVERSRKAASGRTDDDLLADFRAAAAAVRERLDALQPENVVGPKHPLRADDLLAVMCLELGVHAMDLGHSALKGERIAAACVPVVASLLDGVLAAKRPPSLGWDDKTFILTATGRRPLSPNERLTLGELAARFPLVS